MHRIGVDIGGTKVLAVALGPGDDVVATARTPTPQDPDALVDAIVAVVAELDVPAGSLGIGVAGLVTLDGEVRVSPHLTRPDELDLPGRLADRLGVPVRIDNDANTAAWAEAHLGAARGARDVVVVTLGTGIGAGLIVNGALVRGAHGFAGEPGHTTVNFDGDPHVTGAAGSWELYGSGSALRRAAGVEVDEAFLATSEGAAVLDAYAHGVAVGLANLIAVLDPEVVVLGGGVSSLGEPLRAAVVRHLPALVHGAGERPRLRVVLAALGEEAGAIGAALLGPEPPVTER